MSLIVTSPAAMEKIMSGRSAAALMKRAQTLAGKGDDSMIELAEVISDLRGLPKPPDGCGAACKSRPPEGVIGVQK